jgi:serine/threonine-protein kinase
MSPEQALGRKELDARSDIYNVGAVAYYLLTGQLLFDHPSALQMLHAHAFEPVVPSPQFLEGAPADLQRVILRCLEKDPDHRHQDVMTLEKALAACESAGPWTPERAEEWWQQHGSPASPPASPKVSSSDQATIAVGARSPG